MFIILLLSTLTYAGDPVTVPISEGEPAPFSGVLLNNVAAATMIASSEESEARCKIITDSELDLQAARHLRDMEIKEAELTFCQNTKEQLLDHQQKYIDILEGQITKKKIPPELMFGIGVVAGVGLTIGSGYAVGQVAGTIPK